MNNINIPAPDLQIKFTFALDKIRKVYLQEALSKAVDELEIPTLDNQLAKYVPPKSLKALAKCGLRGELLFSVPCVLEANPYILGYYRLLLGFSQKEFYTTKFGVSKFKSMEVKGILSKKNQSNLQALCQSMINSSCATANSFYFGTSRYLW